MKLSDFTYTLPKQRIAKVPVEPRDHSKLLILNKETGTISDDHFYNLDHYVSEGDVLVRNNTKVIPAKIYGKKTTGGSVEILLAKKISQTDRSETWECLTKPGIKPRQKILFSPTPLTAECVSTNINSYTRLLTFNQMGPQLVETLETIGITPLPPYIADETEDNDDIRKKYQTIYAKHSGSAAAPTAGLHFTESVEKKLVNKGVKIVEVTLHVGLGTFLPVKTKNITDHSMHSEWYEISQQTADTINTAKANGNKIICVGTTSSRVLESAAIENTNKKIFGNALPSKIESIKYYLQGKSGETDIFMYPGYEFKIVDSLLTNFHLPESTLLMLVSAFVSQPNTKNAFSNFLQTTVGDAYTHAIKNNYRFYSFGDAMLIH